MEYPDDFNTPSYPAGPRIASTRIVSIAIIVVFLLIIFSCGLVLWAQRSVLVHPFLVSINNITGQWEVVGHNHGDVREITTTQSLQESVLHKFIQKWFWISDSDIVNSALWSQDCNYQDNCSPDKTGLAVDDALCALYCLGNDGLYSQFYELVVPSYQLRAQGGETWSVDTSSIQMLPIGEISEAGGAWQIRATIYSNKVAPISVLAYAQISRNIDVYPQTMGYYVSKFDSYKMN